jgi:hypothetical protein
MSWKASIVKSSTGLRGKFSVQRQKNYSTYRCYPLIPGSADGS